MTSSYGGGYKPYMGVPGHGNMNVGPVVFDRGYSGTKPVPASPKPNVLSTGPVKLPPDPSKMSTKQLLNGGRAIPKTPASAVPASNAAKGLFGGRMAGIFPGIQAWATRNADTVLGRALSKGGSFLFGRDDGSANLLLGAMETASLLDSVGVRTDNLILGKQEAPQVKPKNPPKSVVENPNDDLDDPIAGRGPKGNEVGSDADPLEPGLQGPGDPGAITGNPYKPGTQDHGMYIWAKTHGKMAQDVLDKVEKRGLKQAGYTSIREALGQTPKTPPTTAYEGGTGLTGGEFEAPELKGGVTYDPDFKVDYSQNPQGFLKDKISLLTTSASSFQQPNFDGTSQPIGGNSPKDPQPEQDFNNANTNPAEVVPTTYHPLNIKPSPEAEAANAEYGAMKFEFDPAKNMMVRIK